MKRPPLGPVIATHHARTPRRKADQNRNLMRITVPTSLPLPTSDDRTAWKQLGYLAVPGLFRREAIAEVERLLDALLMEKIASGPDDWTQLRDDDRATSVEILGTAQLEPRLMASEVFQVCEIYAANLLGMPMEFVFDHVIRKTAGIGAGTRWHQDTYYEKGEPYRNTHRVHFWIPMADVPLMGGAMRYIPGTHGGKNFEHQIIPGKADTHYVMATGFDESAAMDVPIACGGAILHHPRLLHGSGPNTSDQQRTAWILQFATPRTLTQKLRYRSKGWIKAISRA